MKEMLPKTKKNYEEYQTIPYQKALGSSLSLYASQGTSPHITFAINTISQFTRNHEKAHWTAERC